MMLLFNLRVATPSCAIPIRFAVRISRFQHLTKGQEEFKIAQLEFKCIAEENVLLEAAQKWQQCSCGALVCPNCEFQNCSKEDCDTQSCCLCYADFDKCDR